MMKYIETFIPLMTAIVTGLFTFFITRFNYNKNIPLDKLEISYNRIYYPLYKLIYDNNEITDEAKNECIFRFNKYHKYVDESTLKSFESLCKAKSKAKKKAAYQIFKSNIYDKSVYLRRRLGYLEPNLLQLYKYSSSEKKSTLKIVIWFSIVYIFIALASLFTGEIQTILLCISIVFFILLLYEIIVKFFKFLYYKIGK